MMDRMPVATEPLTDEAPTPWADARERIEHPERGR